MITHYLTETVSEFLQSRATNTIGHHRVFGPLRSCCYHHLNAVSRAGRFE